MIARWKNAARSLRQEVYALYLAYRDPRVPGYARLMAAVIVAYAFSPIDLIPDFIPILGYLDDLILLPLAIAIVLRMIPPAVMAESRALARERMAEGKPVSRAAAIVIVGVWLVLAGSGIFLIARYIAP